MFTDTVVYIKNNNIQFIAHYCTVISLLNDYFNELLQNIERLPRRQIPIGFISEKVIFLVIQATLPITNRGLLFELIISAERE